MNKNIQSIAAVDIGSNSFHVITARIVDGKIQPLYKSRERVRLAQGLKADNSLTEEAIERGVNTLKQFKDVLSGIDADSIRIVGTYTLRAATNSAEFLAAAEEVFPHPIEIIPGIEEARLIYQGVAYTHSSTGKRIVVDIGGGSTEFAAGNNFDTDLLRSLSMGCVSYKERYFPDGSITLKAFKKAYTAAQQELEMIESKYRAYGCETFIGTSGTIKSLAAIANGEGSEYLTRKQLGKIRQTLLDAGHSDNLAFENISPQRCQVLASGVAILEAIYDSLGIDKLEIADAALREGVLYEMADRLRHVDIREATVDSLKKRYFVDEAQTNRVGMTAMDLYLQVKDDWKIATTTCQQMLKWATHLHEVGININTRGYHKHSAYILENEDLSGFNQEQQLALSLMVKSCRNRLKPETIPKFHIFKSEQIIKLVILLRLAILLNLKRLDNFLPEIDLQVNGNVIKLTMDPEWLEEKPLVQADLESEQQYLEAANFELQIN